MDTTTNSGSTRSAGSGGGCSIGASKAPGQTQPVMTPGKIKPDGSVTSGRNGPILFERTGGNAEVSTQGLKGRGLRGGGGPGADGNVNVSKVRASRCLSTCRY